MGSYSITELQQLSGIKAHTIRMWEQRYNALQPKRSEGNTRFYDDDQLRRLLNIVTLVESGLRVSEACTKSDKELSGLLDEAFRQPTGAGNLEEHFISQMLLAGLEFDEAIFEKAFAAALLRYGWQGAYFRILLPVLSRVGLLWGKAAISPAQEHFLSNLVRQKLFAAIDANATPPSGNDTWLLFLPEDELHEIGLLFAHYYLRTAGKRVIYLGADVPLQSVKEALQSVNATHLYTFLVHHVWTEDATYFIQQLRKIAPHQQLLISGNEKVLDKLPLPAKAKAIRQLTDLETWL